MKEKKLIGSETQISFCIGYKKNKLRDYQNMSIKKTYETCFAPTWKKPNVFLEIIKTPSQELDEKLSNYI